MRALTTSAVQRGRCTPEEILAEYRSGPRQGSKLLRLALNDVLDGARSIAEATASRKLTRPGIPPFVLNSAIMDAAGTMVAIADVYWPDLRAILEIDSREYHFSETDWHATTARHNRLTRLGFTVTHYAPSVVNGRDNAWLDEVQQWLVNRAREIGVPFPAGRGPRRSSP